MADNDPRTRETIDLFTEYEGADKSSWNTQASNDLQFLNNAQWEMEIASALEADNQPVVVNNEMKPARDQVVQQLTDNNPRWVALPRENSDSEVAGAVSDLGSYIWDTSTTNMHFRKATEDFTDSTKGTAMLFRTSLNGTTSPTERMRIDHNGNVGIGTTTPQSALQVNGYTQLALTSGSPPAVDCNEATERGRMKVDSTAGSLYICVASGWVAK
jgi:hypothetical protein